MALAGGLAKSGFGGVAGGEWLLCPTGGIAKVAHGDSELFFEEIFGLFTIIQKPSLQRIQSSHATLNRL